MRSRDSSVGIATGYLEGRGSIPARPRDLSLMHNVKTGSEAHWASYTMGTGGSFYGGKFLSSAEVKNNEAIPPLPHTSSWYGA
jgi:hypothetical protein